MDKWDEAATQLSDEIGDESGATDKQKEHLKNLIELHHADLRRTYKKLAIIVNKYQRLLSGKYSMPTQYMMESIDLDMADPDVIEAMKGEEK